MIERTQVVNVVILDMDNTLYDWLSYFVPAIDAMLEEAGRLLDTDAAQLRHDLQAVHLVRRNTEYPFALLETEIVGKQLPTLDRRERYDFLKPAFDAFNEVRKERLQLYPGVRETLQTINATGCRVFGHTEASEVNISSRVRALGLNEVFEEVYALRFEGMPHPLGSNHRVPSAGVDVRVTPFTALKPDPSSIKAILAATGAAADRCLYVGDSLAKDVTMAKRAGVQAAWARYGTHRDPQLWRELVEITHWDTREVAAVESGTATPDVTIDSFEELLLHFDFSAMRA